MEPPKKSEQDEQMPSAFQDKVPAQDEKPKTAKERQSTLVVGSVEFN